MTQKQKLDTGQEAGTMMETPAQETAENPVQEPDFQDIPVKEEVEADGPAPVSEQETMEAEIMYYGRLNSSDTVAPAQDADALVEVESQYELQSEPIAEETANDEDTEAMYRSQDSSGMKANPDSQAMEELSSIYRRKRNTPATEAQKQTLYREGRSMIRLVGETSIRSDAERYKEEYLKLSHALNQAPLTGIITGVVDSSYMPIAKVKYGEGLFDINIPATYLFDFDERQLGTAEGHSRIMNEMNHRIDSIISFMVFQVDENSGKVYASRINAMDYYGKRNFIAERSDGRPLLYAGLKSNARVMSVHRNDVTVEVGGVECTIPRSELSWTPLENLNQEYHVNDEFLVKILKVARYKTTKGMGQNRFENMISLDVSRKQAMVDPVKKYFNSFEKGGHYVGVVKYITQGVVHVLLADKIGIVCPVPHFAASRDGDLPVKGQKCLIRVARKEIQKREDGSERYVIGGHIINYSPAGR